MGLWRKTLPGLRHGPGEARAWKDARLARVAEVWERDAGRCGACRLLCTRDPGSERPGTVDHILPRSEGGGDELENLRLLCLTCHRVRHDPVMGKTTFEHEDAFLDALVELSAETRCTEPDGVVIGLNRDDLEQTRERLIVAVSGRETGVYFDKPHPGAREELLGIRLGRGMREQRYSVAGYDVRRPSALAGRTFLVVLIGDQLRTVLAGVDGVRSRLRPGGRIIG